MVLLAVLPGLSGLGQSCEYLATLTVDSFPAVQSGLTTYRVYLVTPDSNQYVTRVGAYDDAFADLILSVPSGAYNSVFGGVTAELINPALFSAFPELQDDSFVTIGLDGPAFLSESQPAADPVVVGGNDGSISEFFSVDGSVELNASFGVEPFLQGYSWGLTGTEGLVNAYGDENGRVLLMQVTTAGTFGGTLPIQLAPPYSNVAGTFEGAGTFPLTGYSGCLDPNSCIYDPCADTEGSCTVGGCMDINACNYDSCATSESYWHCDYGCIGCTDPVACNYDVEHTVEDESCLFYDECGTCDGDNSYCSGCTDSSACNYDPDAIVEDGSCKEFDQCGVCGGSGLSCLGCLDSLACNFDSLATIDAGGCLYGSQDLTVFVQTDNWPSEFFWSLKDEGGTVVYSGGPYLYPGSEFVETLCFSPGCYTASVFDSFGDGICCHPYFGDGSISFTSNGVELGRADDFGYSQVIEICIGPEYGCTDEAACNFDVAALIENHTCTYPDVGLTCEGDCILDDDGDGICDAPVIEGCTYGLALNFNPESSSDDGSCIFDLSQDAPTLLFDEDFDMAVSTSDFLAMLAVFGDSDSDADGVWDSADMCTDVEACNFQSSPTEECAFDDATGNCGGDCQADADNDGICDDLDPCVGALDECGVCHPFNEISPVVETVTNLVDSVYMPLVDEWHVYTYGTDTSFVFPCTPEYEGCGDVVHYQGYNYRTVQIGEQCWFAENLRSEFYANGDAIPTNFVDSVWTELDTGAMTTYGAGTSYCPSLNSVQFECDSAWSINHFGLLYNSFAAVDDRGLCPGGWHVSTDDDWKQMERHLGLSPQESDLIGWRGTDEGDKLKAFSYQTFLWDVEGLQVIMSGFSALPAGYRRGNIGSFWSKEYRARFWTPAEFSQTGGRELDGDYPRGIHRSFNFYSTHGFSIRCVEDAE